MISLLEKWKTSATRRAEFALLLQEPAMQDAIAIVREQTFLPKPILPGTLEIIAHAALMGQKREGYLECLTNFLSLANVSPFSLVERKPWAAPDLNKAKESLIKELGVGTMIPADSLASKPPVLTETPAPVVGDAPNPQPTP